MNLNKVFALLSVLIIFAVPGRDQQISKDATIVNNFPEQGPVIIGSVKRIDQPVAGVNGAVTISVAEQLRDPTLGSEVTTLYSPGPTSPKYPRFGWNRLPPVLGHTVLLFLTGGKPDWQVIEVLDLEKGENGTLPSIRAMIALQTQAARGEQAPLFEALSRGNHALRNLAADLLLRQACVSDSECRTKVLRILSGIAQNSQQPDQERAWAVSTMAHRVFTGFPNDSAVDRAVIASLIPLLTDSISSVRGEAIESLHGLLMGGGDAKPQVVISDAARTAVLAQLRRDARSGTPFDSQARDLSDFLATH